MSFKINSLYLTKATELSHKAMLPPGTTKIYRTYIPGNLNNAFKDDTKIVSFGQQLAWKWLHDEFEENFFFTNKRDAFDRACVNGDSSFTGFTKVELKKQALQFVKDMSSYLGMEYDGKHFEELWDLGYLPIRVKILSEGSQTNGNIPHMTLINTNDDFAWLPSYLEKIVLPLIMKSSYAATISKLYRKQAEKWVNKTDNKNIDLVDFMCIDSATKDSSNLWDMIATGLGFATSFKNSNNLSVIPASRYFYGVKEDEMPIFSVNASEHSVSCVKIFSGAEKYSQVEELFDEQTNSWKPIKYS